MENKDFKEIDVIKYFDSKAKSWDQDVVYKNSDVINLILDNSEINSGVKVLDVGCGTGVLFPYYLERNAIVTGMDISNEMVKIAKEKYPEIEVINGDGQQFVSEKQFDRIVVYNAFPHFTDPNKLISNLKKILIKDGVLTIAHGKSRDFINHVHDGKPNHVSNGLMAIEQLSDMMSKYLEVTLCVSDDKMYQIVARKVD